MLRMKKRIKYSAVLALALMGGSAIAGNPQRAGQAGASELMINPWARSAGWGGVNVAGVKGLDATYVNIAGIANTESTEIAFSNSQWLVGSEISINSFGFNQKVGANGVMGANVTIMDYGDIERTTEANPDGGIGYFSPSTAIFGVSYAQRFTESILGGVNIKIFSQSAQDLNASAVCFDAGVQYVTGDEKELKFGVTLKNVGPSATYKGDGQTVNLAVPTGGYSQNYEEKSASFELPALLGLGASYDFNFTDQRLTLAAAFQSNSFEKDLVNVGAEYSIKEMVIVHAGYTQLIGGDDSGLETTAYTGLAAGLGLNVALGESKLLIDYSYRATKTFSGTHSIGIGFSL
ncbi:Protein of unknown function (DUF3308) [Owenweeksia hongkongensis DSM 17368]|uniref:DUF3308 domain-containing protein n=2 Tax=Owenweeksia TaxID=267986 RepID=G8R0U8_OWEHD|nr:Protein of unknown function (DUF3308) [Owenweeksia hongkongensis DSM 17368]